MDRPELVLVTPVWPAAGGFGLAMRAGVFLDALAQTHAVTVVVVPVFGAAPVPPAFVRERARRALRVDLAPGLDPLYALSASVADPAARAAALAAYPRPELCRFATSATRAQLRAAASAPSALVVLRSYLAPYAEQLLGRSSSEPLLGRSSSEPLLGRSSTEPLLGRSSAEPLPGRSNEEPTLGGSSEEQALGTVGFAPPRALLDLDDDETQTRTRLAALHRRDGRAADAVHEEQEAAKYLTLEEYWLPRFDTVLTCSADHARRVATRLPGVATAVLPNSVALPPPRPQAVAEGPPRLLLVGNLSYLPNVDAALWLAAAIFPRVRASAAGAELRIAGSSPVDAVRRLATLPGVEVIADPAELAPHYAWATTAVVPLRAGGGTRIKILEAFAAGVPVVSTPLGAEGIEAAAGCELLLGDSAEALAAACLRLHAAPSLARALAAAARQRVEETYSHAVVAQQISRRVAGPDAAARYDKLPGA